MGGGTTARNLGWGRGEGRARKPEGREEVGLQRGTQIYIGYMNQIAHGVHDGEEESN